jgi:uncharacterized protein (DUF433 family)
MRDGGYYLAGVRVSLASIVHGYNSGQSPEAIHEDFPVQKLSTIYGAIAYYLNHKEKVDKYIEESRREFESHLVPLEQADPELWKRIQRARAKMHESHS